MEKLYVIARPSGTTTSGYKFLCSDLSWADNPKLARQYINRAAADTANEVVKEYFANRGIESRGVRVEVENKPKITFIR